MLNKVSVLALAGFLGTLTINAYAADNQTTTTMSPTQMQTTDSNKNKSEDFLTVNKNKPGVITLPSGLQYKILIPGAGTKPGTNDVVTVNYEGKLTNGTVFDSSYKRGQAATFPVSGVIPGWVEALQLMSPGATWELYIPASLAYGDQGAPPMIGPNETLIFKVQLVRINKQ